MIAAGLTYLKIWDKLFQTALNGCAYCFRTRQHGYQRVCTTQPLTIQASQPLARTIRPRPGVSQPPKRITDGRAAAFRRTS